MSDKHARTEKPTARRREQARKKGQVLRSAELAQAISFLAAVAALLWLGESLLAGLAEAVRFFLLAAPTGARPDELVAGALERGGRLGLPFVGTALAASVLGSFVQASPSLSFEPLQPKLDKLSPAAGFRRLVSPAGLSRLLRGVVGIAALAYVGWSVLRPEVELLPAASGLAVGELVGWVGSILARLFARAAVVFLLLGALDYALAYRQHERSLMMSKEEVKEEHKLIEGNPEVKKRVKRIQRQLARRRMMAEVARATVVVTNPTHVAVALRYEREESPAPRVVAKGKGELALRIRDIARRNGVVVYEDPPLARALYPLELGAVIPPALYQAVAEVLAHLVRIRAIRV